MNDLIGWTDDGTSFPGYGGQNAGGSNIGYNGQVSSLKDFAKAVAGGAGVVFGGFPGAVIAGANLASAHPTGVGLMDLFGFNPFDKIGNLLTNTPATPAPSAPTFASSPTGGNGLLGMLDANPGGLFDSASNGGGMVELNGGGFDAERMEGKNSEGKQGFASGGFTGGVEGRPAGTVHGQELVLSAPAVRALGPMANDLATVNELVQGRPASPWDSLVEAALNGQNWRYANNPVGTSTTQPHQEMRSADGRPLDPVVFTVGGAPVTRSQLRDMAQSGWQTANSVSDGGLAAPGMMGAIRAYHGSPHSFDRFDLARIGTGEGAQAYGHGLYFAGNEGVARGYRDALSTPSNPEQWAASYLNDAGGNFQAAIAKMTDHAVNGGVGLSSEHMRALREGLQLLKSGVRPSSVPGHMYEVNLNVEPGQLLDWDKPMGQQPWEVKQALYRRADIGDSAPGYRIPHSLATTPQAQAAALREAGIPGVQYLDAGSRAAGNGTRNYVMFDDSLINILRKYALPGMVMGGAAAVNPLVGSPE